VRGNWEDAKAYDYWRVLVGGEYPIFCFAGTVPYEDVTESYDQVNPIGDGIDGRESWQTYPFRDSIILLLSHIDSR